MGGEFLLVMAAVTIFQSEFCKLYDFVYRLHDLEFENCQWLAIILNNLMF